MAAAKEPKSEPLPIRRSNQTPADPKDLDNIDFSKLHAPVWEAPPEYDGNYLECDSKTPQEVDEILLQQFTERVSKKQDLDFSHSTYKYHCRVFGSSGDATESTVSIWTPNDSKVAEGVKSVLYMSRSSSGNTFLMMEFRDQVFAQFGSEKEQWPSFGFGFGQIDVDAEMAQDEEQMDSPMPMPIAMPNAMGQDEEEDMKERDNALPDYDAVKYVYGVLNYLAERLENSKGEHDKEEEKEEGKGMQSLETDVVFWSDEDVPYCFAQMTKNEQEMNVLLTMEPSRCDVVQLVLQSVQITYQFDALAIRNLLQGLRAILKAHNGNAESKLRVNYAEHVCALEHVKSVWEQGPVRKLGQYQFRIEPSQQAVLQAQMCIAQVATV